MLETTTHPITLTGEQVDMTKSYSSAVIATAKINGERWLLRKGQIRQGAKIGFTIEESVKTAVCWTLSAEMKLDDTAAMTLFAEHVANRAAATAPKLPANRPARGK